VLGFPSFTDYGSVILASVVGFTNSAFGKEVPSIVWAMAIARQEDK
jgi:hypothetical protein